MDFWPLINDKNNSMIMKKLNSIFFLLILLVALSAKAQEPTVNDKLTEVNDKVAGITERLATDEADLSKLTKIKISGYIQAQFQYTQALSTQPMNNYFSIRRARVKITYEALDGVKFVLQPDFSPQALAIKDAYVVLNDRWTKSFSLWAGKFNRPNYEVEYSSSQREVIERSLVIRTLYPGERAIGAKLEFNPQSLPLHLQAAVFNGADGLQIKKADGSFLYDAKTAFLSSGDENKDYDNGKDIMLRATYNLTLGKLGGLDFGVNGYFGSLKSMTTSTLSSDYTTVNDAKVGDPIKRNWVGGEFQLFADILGGLSVKGEYMAGKNASVGFKPVFTTTTNADKTTTTTLTTAGLPNFQNNFAGYYVYFIKNLGKKNQFAFRYDYYDPNTDIKGKDLTAAASVAGYANADKSFVKKITASDLATTTYGLALHHYFDDNIRITLEYDIVQNEKAGTAGVLTGNYTKLDGTSTGGKDGTGNALPPGLDYSKVVNQNVLTLRIQAKF